MESLFTNVPVKETIEYILGEIYMYDKTTETFVQITFKRLLTEMSTERLFIFDGKFTNRLTDVQWAVRCQWCSQTFS